MNGAERRLRREQLEHSYAAAKVLYTPAQEQFYVITARKRAGDLFRRNVTSVWLEEKFPGQVLGVHYLSTGRTLENVVRFKARAIADLAITDFVEDNRSVLSGLRKMQLNARLWWFDGRALQMRMYEEWAPF